jgi:hypothetical protein
MDSQFTTLTRSYHDNYLQYALTGNQTYQTAYENAKVGLDTIISSLESEVADQESIISNFYKSGVEGKMRDLRSQAKDAREEIVTQGDKITAAKMRQVPIAPTLPQDYTSYYLAIGGLTVAIMVLNML